MGVRGVVCFGFEAKNHPNRKKKEKNMQFDLI
jgi:hypothetical protein